MKYLVYENFLNEINREPFLKFTKQFFSLRLVLAIQVAVWSTFNFSLQLIKFNQFIMSNPYKFFHILLQYDRIIKHKWLSIYLAQNALTNFGYCLLNICWNLTDKQLLLTLHTTGKTAFKRENIIKQLYSKLRKYYIIIILRTVM